MGDELLDHFDIIGVDPRGVGSSTQVQCDADIYNNQLPGFPPIEAAFRERLERNIALPQSCLELTGGPLIKYMDSISIAKDYEAVRVALGSEAMNWFGVSYGTLLGPQYAELFPDNIRAMVLDGVASISQSDLSLFIASATSSEAIFRNFLA